MVLHIANIQTAIDHLDIKLLGEEDDLSHLSLSDCHPVVMHLVESEVSISVQRLIVSKLSG